MVPKTSRGAENRASGDPAPQPLVDEVCEKTRASLRESDIFTSDCVDRVYRLLHANREKLKSSEVLDALSEPTEPDHEDS
jgi:hypothetical protein